MTPFRANSHSFHCCAILLLFLTTACTGSGHVPVDLEKTSFTALSGWDQASHRAALDALTLSCAPLLKRAGNKSVGRNQLKAPASVWHPMCREAIENANDWDAKRFFESHFSPYRIINQGSDTGLFTGYYIPQIKGSLTRRGKYQTPVYGVPKDLKKGKPYHTRAQINRGALKKKAKVIAWVDDPVALFFIEVQGSGFVNLGGGKQLAIGYAGKNNRKYVAIGRTMQEQGLLEAGKVNLFTIKDWLYNHPKRARGVMEDNPSFVFFRPLSDGLIRGGQGVGLTPMSSLAVDYRYYPYGLPVFLKTHIPEGSTKKGAAFNRLMVAQDTGGAIRGGIRGDVYFGSGSLAEQRAGFMANKGQMTVLIPREMADYLGLDSHLR